MKTRNYVSHLKRNSYVAVFVFGVIISYYLYIGKFEKALDLIAQYCILLMTVAVMLLVYIASLRNR